MTDETPQNSIALEDNLRMVKKYDPKTRKIKMVLAYDGTGFNGWQKQEKHDSRFRTIEGTLEKCLRPLIKQKLRFWPSGRTDSGVSAAGQVCAFYLTLDEYLGENCDEESSSAQSLMRKFNQVLPSDISIREISFVSKTFNPMNNHWKQYHYILPVSPEGLFALRKLCAVTVGKKLHALEASGKHETVLLDIEAMNKASSILLGTHDFRGFQSSKGRTNTVRTIFYCKVHSNSDGKPYICIIADGFLYKMARIIAGTLCLIGFKLAEPKRLWTILELRDREMAGPTLPPEALCLVHVEYQKPWNTS